MKATGAVGPCFSKLYQYFKHNYKFKIINNLNHTRGVYYYVTREIFENEVI
jgi:hypothetical protein